MPEDKSSPYYRSVLRIVRRAMHEYDVLGEVSKIKWEPPTAIIVEPKLPTRYCCHNIAFHEPCSKCGRNSEDCKAYIVAAQQRLRDLLRIIGDKP
jgi:hypothetical protein